MANPRAFLDSNILIYTDDTCSPAKQTTATRLIEAHLSQRTGVVSIQALQEYFSVVTGKFRISPDAAREKVQIFGTLTVFQPATKDVLAAIDLHRLHQISFWDALIVRAASQSGCRTLLTEDMQHGRRIDGVEIVNPFLS
uniref:PilT-like protein n=1 Tax=mine drainage metagenome TaxID=410659 RepID=E6PX95_9ZZZZ